MPLSNSKRATRPDCAVGSAGWLWPASSCPSSMSSAALSSCESSSRPRTSLPPGSVVQDKLAVPSAEAGEALSFGLRLRLPFLSSVTRSLLPLPQPQTSYTPDAQQLFTSTSIFWYSPRLIHAVDVTCCGSKLYRAKHQPCCTCTFV
jgi:hypothetical protein